jgi:hypothetical protein
VRPVSVSSVTLRRSPIELGMKGREPFRSPGRTLRISQESRSSRSIAPVGNPGLSAGLASRPGSPLALGGKALADSASRYGLYASVAVVQLVLLILGAPRLVAWLR